MDNLETPSSNIDEKLHLHLTSPPATDTKSPSSILQGTVDSATESPREIHECTPKSDWIFQKRAWDMSNTALDSLMEMNGLCEVKKKFVEINTFIATSGRQQVSHRKNKFGAVFIGNPGTGKTTVAEHYAKFLHEADVLPVGDIVTVNGTRLASEGVRSIQRLLDEVEDGGVLLVDDAHQLLSSGTCDGTAVLNVLLSQVERLTGKVVVVFAGHGKQMLEFRGHHPAFSSLIPTTIKFPDYQDHELHQILVHELTMRFGDKIRAEDGLDGRFMRIVVRRIARGRGRYGFGNARDVQTALSVILHRQADRLFRELKAGYNIDDFYLTQEDLIGPAPSSAFDTSTAWKKLLGMVGLQAVKDAVEALIHRLQLNYERELDEKPLVKCSLNKLFLGNPGTGKTTVAKLYGQILADIGLLSNGEVVLKNPSDFIGSALGQSEANTRAILDATKGKVLIIDEAYMLGGGDGNSVTSPDPYRAAVVDTIAAEVQSTSCEDRCVLLLGYREPMESMLNIVNPALARRFPLASAFDFKDYTDDELRQILDLKLSQQGFSASEEARNAALEVLRRARNGPNFGNAAEVDILLDRAKINQHRRFLEGGSREKGDVLEPQDLDLEFDRGNPEMGSIRSIFHDFVGCQQLVERLEAYQRIARNMKVLGQDPREQIPFNFIFCGPPGTGKTTTAKRMGAVFYEMGLLATKDVVECSATDLIGEYVGHTGPKTKKAFESALGRVLFIDEAYKLADGTYGKDAVIEMVNNLTKDRYRNKLVTILAGYEDDMNELMEVNQGLIGRFPEVIHFKNISASDSISLLYKTLELKGLGTMRLKSSSELQSCLEVSFRRLSMMPSWANARDIHTLSKAIFSRIMRGHTLPSSTDVPEAIVREEISFMIQQRHNRTAAINSSLKRKASPSEELSDHARARARPPPKTHIQKNIDIVKPASMTPTTEKQEMVLKAQSPRGQNEEGQEPPPMNTPRDPNISDEVWNQLQLDKRAARFHQEGINNLRKITARLRSEATRYESVILQADSDSQESESQQKLTKVRQLLKKFQESLAEKEKAAQEERDIQERLKELGNCPFGYEWIRQRDGYRCGGGMHFVSFGEI
ncbi:hypothetical protein ABHI18_010627 [Aspergillus niger]